MRLHHGMLLTGQVGVGKSIAAREIAQALLCAGDDPAAACGECSSCRHLDVHPDLHEVVIPVDKEEIPVDLVRELRESLMRLPAAGRARVVVIDPADRLNSQGQNALLKTLEEPGRNTFLILPTARPDSLLATVRSRVSELRVLPLDGEVLEAQLRGRFPDLPPGDVARVVGLVEGSLGRAVGLLSEENRPLFALLEGFVLRGVGTPVGVARAALEGASGRIATVEKALWTVWIVRTILRKELLGSLATEGTGPYFAATSVRWTTTIESLLAAESDLYQRIPPAQVLAGVFLSMELPAASGPAG